MTRMLTHLALVLLLAGCGGSPTTPILPWRMSGVGNTVFDMPARVERVRITGNFTGSCQNFIVWIGSRLIVNEILGSCAGSVGATYTGTHLTSGGVVEITNSSGVLWTFTQVQ